MEIRRLTCFFFEVLKKFLVEDEGHPADLLHLGLGRAVPVDEVGSDGDGQLPSELLPPEPCMRKGMGGSPPGFGASAETGWRLLLSVPGGQGNQDSGPQRMGTRRNASFVPKQDACHQ